MPGFRLLAAVLLAALVCPCFAFCQEATLEAARVVDVDTAVVDESGKFRPLLKHWESASFGGDGAVGMGEIQDKDRLIELAMGDPMTGIRWKGPVPRENYEIKLKARRVKGFDFFVAVTFPVAKEYCSFVLGGWGGGMVGLSSIDGNDAANNETSQYKEFKQGTWYDVRVRVDKKKITCWIDEEEWVELDREPHSFEVRIEMDPCLPLGIANFQCDSEVKSIELRTLDEE